MGRNAATYIGSQPGVHRECRPVHHAHVKYAVETVRTARTMARRRRRSDSRVTPTSAVRTSTTLPPPPSASKGVCTAADETRTELLGWVMRGSPSPCQLPVGTLTA